MRRALHISPQSRRTPAKAVRSHASTSLTALATAPLAPHVELEAPRAVPLAGERHSILLYGAVHLGLDHGV